MIAVPKDRVRQVQYLIQQSLQGHHVLFDVEVVKRVFCDPFAEPLSEADAYELEPHLERVIELPSLPQKKAYLDRLDSKTLERLIRTYFKLLENSMPDAPSVRH